MQINAYTNKSNFKNPILIQVNTGTGDRTPEVMIILKVFSSQNSHTTINLRCITYGQSLTMLG